ncbi:MAG: type II toxin-antitoxin system HicB family antitoxin [Spirochaetaceae bacterium]|nr:MAG: type II toxin-antitoxin system HicB family antitoxin [Spirochaetaceae bacterium]
MIHEYIQAALNRAHYEMIDDEEPFYGEVRELPGVYASGITLEECRRNLADVVEGWLILSIKRDMQIPEIGGLTIDVRETV